MSCAKLAAIGLHLASWHSEPGFSGVNPGVYVKAECGVAVGAFRNSQRRLSTYAAWTIDPKALPIWGSVGIATGYGPVDGPARPLTPVAMAGVKLPPWQGFRLRVGYIPKIARANETHVLHLMIEREF